ncbi:AAA family ATPase [Oxynema aestuarii]|jgi:hypothetical protein|uniref:AAA family ATPase n=1 Tax=Oxynema aestuarii AP17 TaxID=2064643 RepID=A0A6H1TWP4_9CYAN|nr:AAA family ATPase [Oxynema aestuarii]QIZ71024.1 AAA family ATPase [Oxynema aestuarii AP17]RMH71718.1 MAG: AAA family ATPase [Cyanobacteria bacterium J007]
MGTGYFGNSHDRDRANSSPEQGLLGAGWRPLYREFDWNFFYHLCCNDTFELTKKTLDVISDVADALGRKDYAWWANIFNLFSDYTRGDLDEFWDYITPTPPTPNYRECDTLSIDTPTEQIVSRDSIPIDYVLRRFQEITVFKILDLLDRPNLITQVYQDRSFYYPVERFVSWERLQTMGTIFAYWQSHDIWLQIDYLGQMQVGARSQKRYTLISRELGSLINKATYNLAVMLSGYHSRVGQLNSEFEIRSFPQDIQIFTDAVQQAIFNQNQLAILVHGVPGTGKTAWTQAVAKEILVPLGYTIFILDRDGVENFIPPNYLERICIIINEADNLAQDRSTEIAQQSNRTEHILSLLDGTLYQSIIDDRRLQETQKIVFLMTCNTTERLDPAMLRKGRIDLTCEFTHRFV